MKLEMATEKGITVECLQLNGEYYVAVKPICDALGVDHQQQLAYVKSDRRLRSLYPAAPCAPGADGQLREQLCVPLRGLAWLFPVGKLKVNEDEHLFDDIRAATWLDPMELTSQEAELLAEIQELNGKVSCASSELREKKAMLIRIRTARLTEDGRP
jgi:hypothetical protein